MGSIFTPALASSPLCIITAVGRQTATWNLVLLEVGPQTAKGICVSRSSISKHEPISLRCLASCSPANLKGMGEWLGPTQHVPSLVKSKSMPASYGPAWPRETPSASRQTHIL